MMNRLAILIRRFFQAMRFGVSFTGTRKFRLPSAIRLRGGMVKITAPNEVGLGHDFIALALDDDYGLRQLATPPATILDIGANCGLFSLLAAHYFPAAKIHAYEPNPRVLPYAQGNLTPMGVTVFAAGIGACDGFADMDDHRESRLAQTVTVERGAVKITSLAEAIERLDGEVDFLKLDCEGAEWDIFQAADAFRKIKMFRMEYHFSPQHRMDELQTRTASLGFRLDHLLEHSDYGIAWFSRI